MNKKKILIVCNYKWTYHVFLEKLGKILGNSYNVDICCDMSVTKTDGDDKNVNFINLQIPNTPNIFSFIKSIFALRKIIILNNYDMIISNNRNASFISRVVFFILFRKIFKIYIARGMYFHDAQNIIKKSISILFEYILYFRTDLILSQSSLDYALFTRLFLVKHKYISIIGNGIDENYFLSNKKILFKKKINFCTIGRYSKLKNFKFLLLAFKDFLKFNNHAHLTFIGGDIEGSKEESDLKHAIKSLNLSDKISMTGVVKTSKYYLDQSDIYIHPSLREGVPRSVLEAMAMKKIVIASNIRGCKEIINNEKNGFLFNVNDKKELIKIMLKVSNMNQLDIERITNNARSTIETKYNEKLYLKNQIDIINNFFEK